MPGSGKSSTIHALASELELPIFALSLASKGLDDGKLQGLIAATPSECILTLEDIDCAFPVPRAAPGQISAEHQAEGIPESVAPAPLVMMPQQDGVTLSGLLNAIDGVWSEEGRIIIATVSRHLYARKASC